MTTQQTNLTLDTFYKVRDQYATSVKLIKDKRRQEPSQIEELQLNECGSSSGSWNRKEDIRVKSSEYSISSVLPLTVFYQLIA